MRAHHSSRLPDAPPQLATDACAAYHRCAKHARRGESYCDPARNALAARTPTKSTKRMARRQHNAEHDDDAPSPSPAIRRSARSTGSTTPSSTTDGAHAAPARIKSSWEQGGCPTGVDVFSHTQVATNAHALPASATRNTDTRARRVIFRPRPQRARPGRARRARLGDSGRAAGAAGVYAVGVVKYRGRWARDAKRGCAGADGRDDGGTAESEGRRPERGKPGVRRAGRPAGACVREDAV
ncbi:hypothetical protein B0H17DRAFT_1223185 [Mycena rosella]|uniref:Uncharacterized protein n=1 Tax=Mycena rosella TaxID=1033263 RepID=A0AAD7AX17_MYCRO|nr:hypothetical protein B0H17DRAFT_1223185 [Mycena rosella]